MQRLNRAKPRSRQSLGAAIFDRTLQHQQAFIGERRRPGLLLDYENCPGAIVRRLNGGAPKGQETNRDSRCQHDGGRRSPEPRLPSARRFAGGKRR